MFGKQIIVLQKCSTLYSVCGDLCCIIEENIWQKIEEKVRNNKSVLEPYKSIRVVHGLLGEKFL